MLRMGGYINIIIAVGHVAGLLWADQMFEVTGIEKEMADLDQVHLSLPYLLTIFVAVVFFIFGLYGLSADNNFIKLPFLKQAIFLIAGIYLLRGLGELVIGNIQGTNSITEIIYSLVALTVGLLFLFGGLQKFILDGKNGQIASNR